MSYDTKQVIVVRKDLKMRRGKEIAQGSHASMAFLSRYVQRQYHKPYWRRVLDAIMGRDRLSKPIEAWIDGSFAKVVCQAESEDDLVLLEKRAKELGVECHVITDSGRTEFHGVPTRTALAIGPDRSEFLDKITGHLKLY